ncbi:Carbonic anhydrase 6 [Orchesella cincta]|uniref:carbonic anhydrase n=1 Tax=Orchesella cincta TaxID=48709 RepID=A0A1D2MMW4_ORCCI|nr:Carbonic anhydrase 6 [Orchesella cincta]
MEFQFWFANLVFFVSSASAQFCYSDADGCGPDTSAWPSRCHTGTRQSPIDLPFAPPLSPPIKLSLDNYRGSSFRIQNLGQTISIDFGGVGPSSEPHSLPDPTTGQIRQIYFCFCPFSLGQTDLGGSEHCINGKCAAMELHLVHFLASYGSQASAVIVGIHSLAVIGVLSR